MYFTVIMLLMVSIMVLYTIEVEACIIRDPAVLPLLSPATGLLHHLLDGFVLEANM